MLPCLLEIQQHELDSGILLNLYYHGCCEVCVCVFVCMELDLMDLRVNYCNMHLYYVQNNEYGWDRCLDWPLGKFLIQYILVEIPR